MVCGLHIFQRFIWKPIQYQLHIIVKREARLDQISKVLEQDEKFGIGQNGEILSVQFGLYAAEDITAADGMAIPKDGLI